MTRANFFMKVWLTITLSLTGLSLAYANPNIGTITRITGEVDILTKASKEPKGAGPWIKFEELYYKTQKARVGIKLKNSDVIHTFSNGKAMVIFPNGDQISVGPGTSYEMNWSEKGEKTKPVLKLLYGRVRGVVSPNGPRNVMKMETKSAVAGVRGTDFSIASVGNSTEVSVLRGKVSVAPKSAAKEAIQVEPGFVGQVQVAQTQIDKSAQDSNTNKAPKLEVAAPAPILKKITKEKLVEIQSSSTILNSKKEETVSKEVSKEVVALESKAKEIVLEDIKKYSPKDFEALKNKKELNINEINTSVVSKLFKEAPQEIKEKKFSEEDFEELDKDIYQKYFK